MSDYPGDDTRIEDEAAGSSDVDLPVIPIVLPTHEDLSWQLDAKLREVKRMIEALDARTATLNATAADIQRSLNGLINMVRAPGGVFLGNLAQDTQRMVKRLHDEEFGPPIS